MCWKKFSGLNSHIEHIQLEMALECISKKLCKIEKMLACHVNQENAQACTCHEESDHDEHHEENHDEHGSSSCGYCR
jgi:hypothetical protein